MKVVVLLRTLDEELNIARFCRSYAAADKILIADGGSSDRTIEIAASFRNVEIRRFHRRTHYNSDVFFNPEPMHTNFLIDWALQEEQPDWIVWDDADCIPSDALYRSWRNVLASAGGAVAAYKLYILMEDQYLPRMSIPGQCIWAWRPSVFPEIRADDRLLETEIGFVHVPGKGVPQRMDLEAPFVLLHYFAPTAEVRAKKMARYAARGTPQTPLQHTKYWPPQPLPAWAAPPVFKGRPRRIPRLVKTNVVTCCQCNAWIGRMPKWEAQELGKGWNCEQCGCTSVNVRDGRSFGQRSAGWSELMATFWRLIVDFCDDPSCLAFLWATVETEDVA